MTSYIPEQVYGLIPGTYGQRGLIPWPAHMRPRTVETPDVAPTRERGAATTVITEADDVFFVTVDKRDRQSIATTVERLINMLDDLETDPDIELTGDDEASLGWTERGPGALYQDVGDDLERDEADDEPWLASPESNELRSQVGWCNGTSDDGEISDGDDEPNGDEEPGVDCEGRGWSNSTDIAQEGSAWHGHECGLNEKHRNSPTATA